MPVCCTAPPSHFSHQLKASLAQSAAMRLKLLARRVLLSLPVAFVIVLLVLPLGFMVVVSFWKRALLKMVPAFELSNYVEFLTGSRLSVLGRSFLVSIEATTICLVIAYPIAYYLARHARLSATRLALLLFTIPFLVNYVI